MTLSPWLCALLLCAAAQGASVVSWGNPLDRPEADAPEREYVSVCAGAYHNLALTSDGRLVAWGEWVNGQCNAPRDGGFTAIAAGYYHNLALRSDGTIAAWGNNWRGQCNVPQGERFQTIAAGNWHSLAIRTDGSLAAWGWNEQGQCDPPPGNDYQAICAGHCHSLALKHDGSLVAWGGNGDGQGEVPEGNDFVAIAAGSLHSLALRKDGSLIAWGRNDYGQCNVPSGNDFVAITASGFHSAALRSDGSVVAWGWDRYGQCDVPEDTDFNKIAAGGFHCLAMRLNLVGNRREEPNETEPANVAAADAPAHVATGPKETAQALPDSDARAPSEDRSPSESPIDVATGSEETAEALAKSDAPTPSNGCFVSDAQPDPDPPAASEPNVPAANVPVAGDLAEAAVERPMQVPAPAVSAAEDITSAGTNQEPVGHARTNYEEHPCRVGAARKRARRRYRRTQAPSARDRAARRRSRPGGPQPHKPLLSGSRRGRGCRPDSSRHHPRRSRKAPAREALRFAHLGPSSICTPGTESRHTGTTDPSTVPASKKISHAARLQPRNSCLCRSILYSPSVSVSILVVVRTGMTGHCVRNSPGIGWENPMVIDADRPKANLSCFAMILLLVTACGPVHAGAGPYRNYKSLRSHLASLARREPNLVRLDTLARSLEGRKIWIAEIGRGDDEARSTRPAMLVVAGIEGDDLIGSRVAASWIESLIEKYEQHADITNLLNTTTLYVVPRLNPDAAEDFFGPVQVERTVNGRPFDDDHDGLLDEDGPEDLNADGSVTWMRVRDPRGEYALDPIDERLLVKADPAEREAGAWRYLPEGIDSDHDGKWNEDGPGGVNLNRNFPCRYAYFASDAGLHPVSENETRALADFVVDHANIGIVLTYGAADNLLVLSSRPVLRSGPPLESRRRNRAC